MKKKGVSKSSQHRLLFFGSLSVFVIGMFLYNVGHYAIHIYNLKQQQATLEQQMLSLKDEEENLKIEIQKLKDPDYLARYARENYLYSKDGEFVIRIQPKKESSIEVKNWTETIQYKYIIGGGIVFFACIILYIIIKNKKKNRILKQKKELSLEKIAL